jgi:hypothetical protein
MSTMTDTRAARVQSIQDAAQARQALGQAAHHDLLPDGRHRVRLYDRHRGRLLVGIVTTVAEAISNISKEPHA